MRTDNVLFTQAVHHYIWEMTASWKLNQESKEERCVDKWIIERMDELVPMFPIEEVPTISFPKGWDRHKQP